MKKFLLSIALICSTPCFAFPDYKAVSCTGSLGGHSTTVEYNRTSHLFNFKINSEVGTLYAQEVGNRIYTNFFYVDDDLYELELLSNGSNWNATFNIYVNRRLGVSERFYCKKIGFNAGSQYHKSIKDMMSKYHLTR